MKKGKKMTEYDYVKYYDTSLIGLLKPIIKKILEFKKNNYKYHINWTNENKMLHIYSELKIETLNGYEPDYDVIITFHKPFKRWFEKLLKRYESKSVL